MFLDRGQILGRLRQVVGISGHEFARACQSLAGHWWGAVVQVWSFWRRLDEEERVEQVKQNLNLCEATYR